MRRVTLASRRRPSVGESVQPGQVIEPPRATEITEKHPLFGSVCSVRSVVDFRYGLSAFCCARRSA